MFAKFVAFTHGPYYQVWLQHFPLAALVVSIWHWTFPLMYSMGLWKNLCLDRLYQPNWDEKMAWIAVLMYGAGATFGYLI